MPCESFDEVKLDLLPLINEGQPSLCGGSTWSGLTLHMNLSPALVFHMLELGSFCLVHVALGLLCPRLLGTNN